MNRNPPRPPPTLLLSAGPIAPLASPSCPAQAEGLPSALGSLGLDSSSLTSGSEKMKWRQKRTPPPEPRSRAVSAEAGCVPSPLPLI